jgi:hypothetical protein
MVDEKKSDLAIVVFRMCKKEIFSSLRKIIYLGFLRGKK